MLSRPRPLSPARRRAGWFVGALLLILTVLLALHREVPNGHGLGSLWDSFVPWVGVPLALLGLVALAVRGRLALGAALLAAIVWIAMFGGSVLPRGAGGAHDLRVVSHNVYAGNVDIPGTVRALVASGAGVVTLEEMTDDAAQRFSAGLAAAYPHHDVEGTVGIWSRYPITDVQPVDLRMGWVRAMRAVVAHPRGDVAVYVVHLDSIRIGLDGLTSQRRDRSMRALADQVATDPARRLVLAGDFNTAQTDRSLATLTAQLTDDQRAAGSGFGFTWPASFPVVQLDHILSRGLTVTDAAVLPRTGSDHRPVAADYRFGRR